MGTANHRLGQKSESSRRGRYPRRSPVQENAMKGLEGKIWEKKTSL